MRYGLLLLVLLVALPACRAPRDPSRPLPGPPTLRGSEVEKLLEKGRGGALVATALWPLPPYVKPTSQELLEKALEKEPQAPAVWAAAAYLAFEEATPFQWMQLPEEVRDRMLPDGGPGEVPEAHRRSAPGRLMTALDRLRELDPENALPGYLTAVVAAELERWGTASRGLIEGEGKPGLRSYSAEFRTFRVQTLEALGYSPYRARLSAMKCQVLENPWLRLSQALEGNWARVDQEALLVLTERLEAAPLHVESLVGQSLQAELLATDSQEYSELMQRVERVRHQMSFIQALGPQAMSEERWCRFFDQALSQGESAAILEFREEFEQGLR